MGTLLSPIVLQGRWVRLEPLAAAHVPGLLRAATESRETYGFTDVPDTLPDMTAYVASASREQQAGRMVPFVTRNAESGEIAGATRFGNIEFWPWPEGSQHQRGLDLPDALEIGWTWLAASAQRTPINTEAKSLMLAHAFQEWRVHRVRFRADARNDRSRRAIERLGARLDGVIRAEKPAYDGVVKDTAFYSILDTEWPEVQAHLVRLLNR